MKPASVKPAPGHHRCLYLSATGRQCRSWVIDPRAMVCPRHLTAQPNGPDDFAFQLLHRSCNFQNAEGIHDSLRNLYILLASDAISPRRAAVLGYLTSLLLRTLPAVYNDPHPLAGTPMSAAQLDEREKAKSLAPPLSQPPAPAPAQKLALPQNSVVAPRSTAAQATVQPTPQHLYDPDYLPKGTGPMPATRAEFAAQVLKSLAATPPTPTPPISSSVASTKPNPTINTPTAASPTDKEFRSQVEPPPSDPISRMTTAAISETPSDPTNQPPNKKRYEVRLNIDMPVTGSPPPWGWTTDP